MICKWPTRSASNMSDSKLYGQGSISGRDRDYSIHHIKRMALRPAKSPLLFYAMVTSGSFPGHSQLGYKTGQSSHTSRQARELHGAVLRYTCNFTTNIHTLCSTFIAYLQEPHWHHLHQWHHHRCRSLNYHPFSLQPPSLPSSATLPQMDLLVFSPESAVKHYKVQKLEKRCQPSRICWVSLGISMPRDWKYSWLSTHMVIKWCAWPKNNAFCSDLKDVPQF